MNTKPYLTLSSAAKQSGISKSVISKAIKDKALHVKNTPKGKGKAAGYQIDKTDFAIWEKTYNDTRRQFLEPPKNESKEHKKTPENDLENTFKIKELELELKYKDKDIASLEKQLEKAEGQAISWEEQAQKLLLTHQPATTEPPAAKKHTSPIVWIITGGAVFFLVLMLALYGSQPQVFEGLFG